MNAMVRRIAAAVLMVGALVGSAHGGVVLSSTRMVFPEDQREMTMKLFNKGAFPALVQAWLDEGDASAAPERIDVPFTVTPAMFRLDAARGQTLRLVRSAMPQAQDRESLYWLNVLQIPPKPGADGAEPGNHLQMAVRTRIKVFVRPDGLPGKAEESPAQVTWTLVRTGQEFALQGDNPTPYHVNLGSVALVMGSDELQAESGYIAPGGMRRFSLPTLTHWPVRAAQVRYRFINDFGAGVLGQSPLQ